MCLDRRIELLVLAAALTLTGCGGGEAQRAGSQTTYDYVIAVRPLAYDNAHAACSGHSLTSLAYEYDTRGSTFEAAARSWARLNQPDLRLRGVSFRGCRDGLRQTAARPVEIEPPPLTAEEIEIYLLEYSNCLGLTVAALAQEYGLDAHGMTLDEAVRAVVRRSYDPAYEDVAFEACLAAIRGEPPRYGS